VGVRLDKRAGMSWRDEKNKIAQDDKKRRRRIKKQKTGERSLWEDGSRKKK